MPSLCLFFSLFCGVQRFRCSLVLSSIAYFTDFSKASEDEDKGEAMAITTAFSWPVSIVDSAACHTQYTGLLYKSRWKECLRVGASITFYLHKCNREGRSL